MNSKVVSGEHGIGYAKKAVFKRIPAGEEPGS